MKENLPKTAPIWKRLQRVQRELKHGTPATQDTAVNALRDYLESGGAEQFFPAFLYEQCRQILQYYSETLLPALALRPEDRTLVSHGFMTTLRRLHEREQRALWLEEDCRRLLSRFRNKQFESLRDFIGALCELLDCSSGPDAWAADEASLSKAFARLKHEPFTRAQAEPFFDMLLPDGLAEELRPSFRRIEALFWNQLQEQLQMKVALVNPETRRAAISRLDIDCRVLPAGNDDVHFVPDNVDERMYYSCLDAVSAVRDFLTAHVPSLLKGNVLDVTCRFLNPLLDYSDSSASLAIAVKLVGELLNLEIASHILLSGAVSDSGQLLPVRFLREKAASAEKDPQLREFCYAGNRDTLRSSRLALRRMRSLPEALERCYGKSLEQALLAKRRERIAAGPAPSERRMFSQPSPPEESVSPRKRPLAYSTRPHVGHFVGRDAQLAHLKDELRDPHNVFLIVDGLAGIGKTTLAAKVAEEMEDEFRGVFWTKCTPESDLDQFLAELAYFLSERGDRRFGNVFSSEMPKESKLNFLISSLADARPVSVERENISLPGGARGGFLLVFDDLHELLDARHAVRDPDLELLFTHLLADSHASKVMLVSRIRPAFQRYQGCQSKNTVQSIDEQAGVHLLRKLGLGDEEKLLRKAYQMSAGHPLALELLAGLTEILPLEDLLEDRRIFWSEAGIIERLLQELDASLTQKECRLLSTISLLPRPAGREMIVFLTGSANITSLLTSLIRKALLSYNRVEKVYKLHDLVRDFYRLQMDEERKRAIHLKAAEYYEQQMQEGTDNMTFQQVEQQLAVQHHYFQAGEYEKAAEVLVEASKYLRTLGYLERCHSLLNETLKVFNCFEKTTAQHILTADLLMELSWIERSIQSLDLAIETGKQAERILDAFGDKKRLGESLHAMGTFFYETVNWLEAEKYFARSIEIKECEHDTQGLVRVLKDLLLLCRYSGQLEKLELISKKCVNICELCGDIKSKSEILEKILGRTLEEQLRFDEAYLVYEESFHLKDSIDFIGKSNSLRLLGQILRKEKHFEKALEKYTESLGFARKSENPIAQAYSLQGLGEVYREQGFPSEAFLKYNEAVKVTESSNNFSEKFEILKELSFCYAYLGELDKSLEIRILNLELSREVGDVTKESRSLLSIAYHYRTRYSELDKALEFYQKALELSQKLNRSLTVEVALSCIAQIYIAQGKLDDALEISQNILKERLEHDDYDRAYTLNMIGNIYYLKRKYQKALEKHQESLQICEQGKRFEIKPFTLNYLGKDYIALANYEKATSILKESFRLHTRFPNRKAEPLANIAYVYYCKGKLTDAMSKCEESLDFSRTYGGRIQAGVTLNLMAKIRIKEERYDEALPYAQEAEQIFRETGSRHLPEAETTLKKLQELEGRKKS